MKSIQYTLRDIPPELDQALRARAAEEKESLNTVLRETLLRGSGLGSQPLCNHEFDDLAGKWVRDEACESALEEMRATIDADLWK